MSALIVRRRSVARSSFLLLIGLALAGPSSGCNSQRSSAQNAAAEASATDADISHLNASPIELAGNLAHKRRGRSRGGLTDLIGSIDTALDVAYATKVRPVSEAEQFWFDGAALRTPESGKAILCLPVKVPEFYRLTISYSRPNRNDQSKLGFGLVMGGRQFLVETGPYETAYECFYDRRITAVYEEPPLPVGAGPSYAMTGFQVTVLVGDKGFLFFRPHGVVDVVTSPELLSLDPDRVLPPKDKIFITATGGPFEIRFIQLEPLEHDEWLVAVKKLYPYSLIPLYESILAQQPRISPTVEKLPSLNMLRNEFTLLAHEGNFDGLEQWADRFRNQDLVVENHFTSEVLYDWLSHNFDGNNVDDRGHDAHLEEVVAMTDAWLKHKPDSVAARNVQARAYIHYAWDARGSGDADTVTPEGWQLFNERIAKAAELLKDAAKLPPADSCVFSAMITVGMAQGWDLATMDDVLDRGLKISKENWSLVDNMIHYLFPRWHGQQGDLTRFADYMLDRYEGDDGLEMYGRIAMEMRTRNEDLSDLPPEKLRAAIAVLHGRYPDSSRVSGFICWVARLLDDRDMARPLYADVLAAPDVSMFCRGTEDYDDWRHWFDPSLPDPSQFLAVEGEEIANLQAYTGESARLAFLADNQTLVTAGNQNCVPIKFWNLKDHEIDQELETPFEFGRVNYMRRLSDNSLAVAIKVGIGGFDSARISAPDYASLELPWRIGGTTIMQVSDDAKTAVSYWDSYRFSISHAGTVARMSPEARGVYRVELSHDGTRAVSFGWEYVLWDTVTGEEIQKLDFRPHWVSFLEDGSGFIYYDENKLAVWDLEKKQNRFSIPYAAPNKMRVSICSADSRLLASCETHVDPDGTRHEVVVLRKMGQSEPLHVFTGHKNKTFQLAFSPDGHLLASNSGDGVVKVWDVAQFSASAATPAGTAAKP
ncbi:MAG TPA: WD40 repeat domain-containing protein [Pirellulales bacterium]|nr:WD40 repeat domain-containing protein [Pirellulales bacterium]